jgi:hypothetical protein
LITIKLPIDPTSKTKTPNGRKALEIPARIGSNDTISGWCSFSARSEVISGAKIQSQNIVITDSHGELAEVEPIILKAHSNENLAEVEEVRSPS